MLLHDDLDEAVAAARGERIKPRNGAPLRQDAYKVAGGEPCEPAPGQPLPEGTRGMAKRRIAVGACTSAP